MVISVLFEFLLRSLYGKTSRCDYDMLRLFIPKDFKFGRFDKESIKSKISMNSKKSKFFENPFLKRKFASN